MQNNKTRRTLTKKDKDIIGQKCANCESTINLEYHHIVPIALGGSNLLSNHVCLCSQCHKIIHKGIPKLSYGELGLYHNNGKIGRPKVTTKDININLKNDILEHKITITAISKKYNISRKTIYKYKKILEEEMPNAE